MNCTKKMWSLVVMFFLLGSLSKIVAQQNVSMEGYVFETDNRGYLNAARVIIVDKRTHLPLDTVFSDIKGHFSVQVPANRSLTIHVTKEHFFPTTQDVSSYVEEGKNAFFVKVKLRREPGYTFDVTLARFRESEDSVVDAIEGAWIEIYNNTTREEELNLKDYPDPNFYFTFQQGNHYTIMIRKEGYFTRRLEAYVDVEGCILCFEGIGDIRNVTDNLTEGLDMGVILANIELDPADLGAKYKIENIYYDYDKANIRSDAQYELDKLLQVLKDNPAIIVELGSHTDSRGSDEYNMALSQRRAQSAVDYLVDHGILPNAILAQGYGEEELVNECSNGVSCSAEKHQENRRTEIKVVGYLQDDPRAHKSLAQIKLEENMDQILEELSDEVVEFRAGDDIPQALLDEIVQDTKDSSLFIATQKDVPSQISLRDQSRPEYSRIPPEYRGYSIMTEVIADESQLELDSYEGVREVFLYEVEGDKVGFLIGLFESIDAAESSLRDLKDIFPGAEIVSFRDGKMDQ